MKDLSQLDIKELGNYKNIIAIIVIVIIGGFFMRNYFINYQQDLKKIEAKTVLLENTKNKAEEWRRQSEEYQDLSKYFLTQQPLIVKKYVEKEAKDKSIEINSLKTNKEMRDSLQSVTIELSLTTRSYSNLVSFIKSLEEKNIFIDNFFIDKNQNNKIKARINLNAILIDK